MSTNTGRASDESARRPYPSTSLLAPTVVLLTLFAALTLPVPAGAAKGAAPVALNEHSNGRTVTVSLGTRLNVTLHSTYWSLVTTKTTPDLRQVGKTVVVGVAPNGARHCVPGQGCGTLNAHFIAAHSGTVRLRASRTSCGEALKCSPAQSVWTVVVRVR